MRFSSTSILLSGLAVLASAQQNSGSNPNPFKVGTSMTLTAGQPSTISWTPTTQGPVTLILREGASSNLDKGMVIASGIPNSGSATFTIPADTVRNSDYTIEISSDADPSQVNYTPQFVVESKNTVAPISSGASSAAASSAASSDMSSMPSASNSASASMTSDSSSSMASSMSSSSSGSKSSGMSSTRTSSATSTDSTASTAPSSGAGKPFLAPAGLAMAALGAMVAL